MVTKIVNPTSQDIEFYTPNIKTYLTGKAMPPIKRVVKANSETYSRSVTGDTNTEEYLVKMGCTLSQVRRSLCIIVAGQSNAVGYDETPWDENDVKPLPYCYFEGQKTHGGYGNAEAVPMWSPGVDCYQDMQNVGSVGTRTKGLHYELAKKLIGIIPDGFELEIWGWAMGMSGMCVGQDGTVTGQNLPSGSTKWNNTGGLTIASGKRLNAMFGSIQKESKLIGVIWCQGEYDGMENVSVENYAAGFQAMVDKMQSIFQGDGGSGAPIGAIDTAEKILYREFKLNTKTAHSQTASPLNNAAFVEFTGGTFMAPPYGRYNYFGRNDFRTNLTPELVEVKYGSTAPVISATGEVTASTDREGYAVVDFYNVYIDGRVKYGLVKSDVVKADLPIYCTFFNKLNGKYMGYVILNWSYAGSIGSPAFEYVEENAQSAFKYPLWLVYPGPQKYWNTKGTFKDIIAWQKENFTSYIDLPEDLPTNDCSPTGTKARAWDYWNGYGFTSSAKASHYGQNSYKYIANAIYLQIKKMFAVYGTPDLEEGENEGNN